MDTEVAYKNLEIQEKQIAELRQQLNTLMPNDMPPELDFNWGSDFHVSALLYGGPIKYRKKVPYDPPEYVKEDYYQLTDGQFIAVDEWTEWASEHDTYLVQEGVCRRNYASGKNKGLPKVFREDTTEEKLKWAEFSYYFPGVLKLRDLPELVQEKFLGKRAEWRQSRTLCDGITPVYSSSGDALAALKVYCKEVALLVKLGQLEKDTGSFYLRTDYNPDGSVKKVSGMLQYVQPDGIIHHNLNATATVTGRLSSSQPNL